MRKKRTKRLVSLMLIVTLLLSVFPSMLAAEGNTKEDNFNHLLGNTDVKRPSEAGALQLLEIDGQMTLADENGEKIQLRGMSTHGLQWFPEILNDNAYKALTNDWESNMIRLAMYVGENGYNSNPELIKSRVIKGIDLAIENDMYVIVDWHVHAPGDPRDPVYAGAEDFFREIAELYPNNKHIIYELANEPSSNNNGGKGIPNNEEGWKAVKEYADPIVEMLRESGNADDNIIIVGSPNWSQRPDLAADNPIDDHHTMYTVHFYTGSHAASTKSYPKETPNSERGNVMSNTRYALENGVAVFATEWGTSQASGDGGPYFDEADVWIEFLNENNISWANWSLTNKNEVSGAFTPFELGKTNATNLDPGSDQVWAPEELSLSGEYVRARIKGVNYEPIDRTKYTKVLWDFNDGTKQGFGVNADSPNKEVITVDNVDNALKISGLDVSNDISDGNYWANARLSANDWGKSVDVLGAEKLTMDVIVDEPTTVAIAAIPQGPSAGWANPNRAIKVKQTDFVPFGDKFKAQLTITTADSPSLETIAMHADNNIMNNIILFVGTEDADVIYLDNIKVTGTEVEIPVVHDPKGEAALPSDFEDGTRQGWDWAGESGVKTALTIEEANGSNALSWEFGYPEVKPSDNWATAPRLDFWKTDLVRGENDYVAFDFYLDPVRATEGAMNINIVFQPPANGYWVQAPKTFTINFDELEEANQVNGLYHYEVKINVRDITNIQDDTLLRNMMVIFADVQSDFAGRVFVDNVRFEATAAEEPEPVDPGEDTPPVDEKEAAKEEREAAREEAKEEREAAKEEREAAREVAKEEREAAKEEKKEAKKDKRNN
uniref:cellulase n=1 Tax=Bacillus sp. NW-2004a TaxID=289996 RepID=Q68NH6_9BACI|nr:endo-1,4-beta-glucanase [Bacillus sp. NW-2004a]